jgi:putative PIG3 family NAD(P)H quinone oxidoreductase
MSRMRVVEIASPGGPEVLRVAERDVPEPGPGELRIRVAAAGVNRPDLLQRQGRYPPPPGASDIPGLEVAGRVEALGAAASRFRVGDAVCALVAGGGYAELCVAPEPQCLPVPTGLDLVAAAAIPETFFTVWHNVFERGRLAPGESLLVHGGTSGIGTTAIQLGRAHGSRVFATTGSEGKRAICESLGAERAIVRGSEDFVALTRELTAGKGVDVILDMLGGPAVGRNLEALAVEGRLVQIAFVEGSKAEVDLSLILRRRLTFTGSSLRPRSVAEKGAIARGLEERVWPWLAEGRVRPVVHATFPLAEAAAAHRLLESRGHVGKVVLTL